MILSTMRLEEAVSPFLSLGAIGNRNNGAGVGLVVAGIDADQPICLRLLALRLLVRLFAHRPGALPLKRDLIDLSRVQQEPNLVGVFSGFLGARPVQGLEPPRGRGKKTDGALFVV